MCIASHCLFLVLVSSAAAGAAGDAVLAPRAQQADEDELAAYAALAAARAALDAAHESSTMPAPAADHALRGPFCAQRGEPCGLPPQFPVPTRCCPGSGTACTYKIQQPPAKIGICY